MTNNTLLGLSIASALGLSFTPTAFAADNAPAKTVERIEVLGSHIKRTDIEGNAPVLQIERESLEKSGFSTVREVLEKMSSAGTGTFSTQGNNQDSSANGAAGISLRGFGADATLVLLNGRRVAISSFAQKVTTNFVDINSIPVAAIERVEILKDGASASYGSDAVAGVVNIVLRKDFEGTEVSLGYGNTTDSDASEKSASLITGFGDEKANGTLIFDYFAQNALLNKDRDFADSADHRYRGGPDNRSSTGYPGSFQIRTGGTDAAPIYDNEQPDPACPANMIKAGRCRYDYAPSNVLFPATERAGMMFLGQRDLTDNLTGFVEVAVQHNTSEAQGAPSPGTPPDGLLVPAESPFNPYGADVFMTRYRTVGAGPRRYDVETDNQRVVLGLRGTISDSWDWEGSMYRTRSESTQSGSKGWVRADKLRDAFAGELDGRPGVYLNPFGGGPIPADILRDISTSVARHGESRSTNADLNFSGPLFALGDKDVMMATGLEYQEEEVFDRPDRQFSDKLIVGTEAVSAAASRDRKSAFIEFIVPIFDGFEAQLAGRYDEYNDFGGTTNPKLGLRWDLADNFFLRGSWGTGFRAPSLAQIGLGPSEESPQLIDTHRCAQTGSDNDCKALEYTAQFSGNPSLKPEKSESWTFGGVWQITEGLSLTTDIWRLEQTQKIDKDLQYVVDTFGNTQNSTIIERFSPTVAGQLGEIRTIHGTFFNIGFQEAQGIDVNAAYRLDMADMGNLNLSLDLSHIDEFNKQVRTGTPTREFAGEYEYPENRWTGGADWTLGDWGTNLSLYYIGEFDDYAGYDPVSLESHTRTVDSMLTASAQLRYNGFDNTQLSLGIDNLLDEEPPYADADAEKDPYGYVSSVHNPRGRYVYGKVTYRF